MLGHSIGMNRLYSKLGQFYSRYIFPRIRTPNGITNYNYFITKK